MRDVLKRIESNGKHLLGLINDVLDLSKIEAGQLTLSVSDYSLENVIRTVFSAVEPLAAEKQIAFRIDVAPELPQGRGDEQRLTQVLLNLVGNAIKFTDAGEVSIRGSSADGSFHVAVRDTGPGISAADQGKLFQEFQQADNSITRKKGGTGLGLAISRQIVEMHGGHIWVESSPGRGSTFSFTLPVTVEQEAGTLHPRFAPLRSLETSRQGPCRQAPQLSPLSAPSSRILNLPRLLEAVRTCLRATHGRPSQSRQIRRPPRLPAAIPT
jgi:signal transduction histidine kinase